MSGIIGAAPIVAIRDAFGPDGTPIMPFQKVFGTGNLQLFFSSDTFLVPPGVKRIRVRVHAGGGSGGACTSNQGKSAGGAGGGFSMKEIDVVPGASYSVTVGKGGAARLASGGANLSGNAGQSSSFGSVCSATGGAGGAVAASSNPVAGAVGGTGTGGDVNFQGGASGQVYYVQSGAGAASGGGSAAGPWGPGKRSGNIVVNFGSQYSYRIGTGGASITFAGPDLPSVPYTADYMFGGCGIAGAPPVEYPFNSSGIFVGGASLFGAIAPFEVGAVPIRDGSVHIPPFAFNRFAGDILAGGGGQGQNAATDGGNGGPGAGGGASYQKGGRGGAFGGGGACVQSTGNSFGGAGGFGAGGGGAAASSQITDATSGAGGDGLVIVEW